MSSYNDEPNPYSRIATKTVVEHHLKCLKARNDYIEAVNRDLGDSTIQMLHQELQNRVLAYFETLRYNLRTKASVEEYWNEKVLWTETVYKRDENGVPQVDEDGNAILEEKEYKGLKQLESFYDSRTTDTRTVANCFGEETVESSKPATIPVDTLFRIARLLDEATEKLGLLTEVKTPVARPEEAEV